MHVTWKDGVTTLAAAGAVVLERAYFHNWDWPLISNIDWVIAGLAGFMAVGLVFSYLLDAFRGVGWTMIASGLALAAAVFAGLGLYYHNTDYVVVQMLTMVMFWMASIVRHVTVQTPMTHSHV